MSYIRIESKHNPLLVIVIAVLTLAAIVAAILVTGGYVVGGLDWSKPVEAVMGISGYLLVVVLAILGTFTKVFPIQHNRE